MEPGDHNHVGREFSGSMCNDAFYGVPKFQTDISELFSFNELLVKVGPNRERIENAVNTIRSRKGDTSER